MSEKKDLTKAEAAELKLIAAGDQPVVCASQSRAREYAQDRLIAKSLVKRSAPGTLTITEAGISALANAPVVHLWRRLRGLPVREECSTCKILRRKEHGYRVAYRVGDGQWIRDAPPCATRPE